MSQLTKEEEIYTIIAVIRHHLGSYMAFEDAEKIWFIAKAGEMNVIRLLKAVCIAQKIMNEGNDKNI